MSYDLLNGGNDPDLIDLLIDDFTKMDSDDMRKALHYYFVNGFEIEQIASMTPVLKSNLSRDVAKINAINKSIEKVKELQYYKINRLNNKGERR